MRVCMCVCWRGGGSPIFPCLRAHSSGPVPHEAAGRTHTAGDIRQRLACSKVDLQYECMHVCRLMHMYMHTMRMYMHVDLCILYIRMVCHDLLSVSRGGSQSSGSSERRKSILTFLSNLGEMEQDL